MGKKSNLKKHIKKATANIQEYCDNYGKDLSSINAMCDTNVVVITLILKDI